MTRIAALTSVRNDPGFLPRWIAYYGRALGPENLYVVMDGFDQPLPEAAGINIIRVPFVSRPRLRGDKFRAARATGLAHALLTSFDMVIGTDVDEFIVPDPKTGQGLVAFLQALPPRASVSALGLDVVQNPDCEGPLDPARPVLAQRSRAVISDRYTKASVLTRPVIWGAGQHRVRGRSYHIAPDLYLFHFGSADRALLAARAEDHDRRAEGWAGHQARRDAMFDQVQQAQAEGFDSRIVQARAALQRRRRWPAWNKPAPLRRRAVVEIPQRFATIV